MEKPLVGRTWRMGKLVAVLVGAALVAGTWDRRGQGADDKTRVPADLQLVPSDALGMVSFRLADLWTSEPGKGMRQHFAKDLAEQLREFEKLAGVAPENIERMTLVWTELRGEGAPVILVATAKAYDRAKVLAVGAPGATETTLKGKPVYLSAKDNKCFYFINDRAFLFSRGDLVRDLLDKDIKNEGPLQKAVRLASQKHLVVGGLNAATIAQQVAGGLPPQADALRPLLQAQSATLVADLDAEAKATVSLHFGQADEAKEGEKAVKAGFDMALPFIAQGLKELEKHSKESTKLLALLRQGEASLKAAKVEQDEKAVKIAVRVKVDQAALAGALVEALTKTRQAAARMQSANNLKQLGLAMHNYHAVYGQFPPAAIVDKDGKPLLSWRVTLLPFLEHEQLYKEFHLDEAWDSPHNKKLLEKMPHVFAAVVPNKAKEPNTTFYLGFNGKGALFEGVQGTPLAQITDGTSNTIMFVEAAKAVPWSKPEDLPFDPDKDLPKVGSMFEEGFNAAFCDGSVRFISKTLDLKTLKALITRNGGEVIGELP